MGGDEGEGARAASVAREAALAKQGAKYAGRGDDSSDTAVGAGDDALESYNHRIEPIRQAVRAAVQGNRVPPAMRDKMPNGRAKP